MASVEKQIHVEVAKGILRDKFEDLQAYSASLESFSLHLKGLDDLFDSIHGSVEARFADAESRLKLKQNPPADCFRNVDSESKLKQKNEKQDSISKRKQKMASKQKQKGLDPVALKSEGSKVKRKKVRSSNGSSTVELESKRMPHEESSIPSVTNCKSSPFLSPTLDWFVTPRPALMLMCGKMDSLGLMVFLNYFSVDFRDEIASALLSAPDPSQLLLSALEISALKSKSSAIDVELSPESWSSLLQIISMVTPVIKSQVREKAVELVEHCRNNDVNNSGDEIIFRSLAILILVAYGSESILEERWIFDLVEIAARRPQAAALCRIFGFTDRIPEFVEYLLTKEKRMEALNFIFEFGLLDQFPAYPLLKEHLSLAKKTAKRISKEANNSTESQILGIDIQVAAVNDVLRCIQEHEIECKYNVCNMSTRLEKLGLEKLNLESGAS